MKIYCAAPITGKTVKEVQDYYTSLTRTLSSYGWTVLSPMVGKKFSVNEEFKSNGYNSPLKTDNSIYKRDKWMVNQADVVYADFTGATRVSIGMCMELALAEQAGKYVVAVIPEGNIHVHAFVLSACSTIYRDNMAAISYLITLQNSLNK